MIHNKTNQILIVLLCIIVALIIINNNFKLKRVGNVDGKRKVKSRVKGNNKNSNVNENFTDILNNRDCDVNNVNTIKIGRGQSAKLPNGRFYYYEDNNDDLSLDFCKGLCENIDRCSHYTHETNVDGNYYGKCKLYESCIPTPKELNVENIDIHCALGDEEKCKEKRTEFPLVTSNQVMPFDKYGKQNVKCEGRPIPVLSYKTNNKTEQYCANYCHDLKGCNLTVYEKGITNDSGKCTFYKSSDDCDLVKSDKHKLYCRVPNEECSKVMRKNIKGTMLTGTGAEGRRYVFNTGKQDIPVVFK